MGSMSQHQPMSSTHIIREAKTVSVTINSINNTSMLLQLHSTSTSPCGMPHSPRWWTITTIMAITRTMVAIVRLQHTLQSTIIGHPLSAIIKLLTINSNRCIPTLRCRFWTTSALMARTTMRRSSSTTRPTIIMPRRLPSIIITSSILLTIWWERVAQETIL